MYSDQTHLKIRANGGQRAGGTMVVMFYVFLLRVVCFLVGGWRLVDESAPLASVIKKIYISRVLILYVDPKFIPSFSLLHMP